MRLSTSAYCAIIILIIVVVFSPLLNAGFMGWDDAGYVINNPDIKELTTHNLNKIFSSIYLGNYQPISMLSYMPDYFFGNGSATIFHISNIVYHILTCLMVFFLVNEISSNTTIAFYVAILYSIHPLNTESVAWISERKNLMYGIFYWLSLLLFMKYVKNNKRSYYFASLVVFILSMLSKAQAVSLPISIIGILIIANRNYSIKPYLVKLIPYFALSLFFGIFAIYTQRITGYAHAIRPFNFIDNVAISCTAYIMYIYKIAFPFQLSVLYPLPKYIPWYYYVSIVFILLFAVTIGINIMKKRQHLLTGYAIFFTSNIIFILHFIPLSQGIISDRYTYIAQMPLLLFGVQFFYTSTNRKKFVPAVIGVVAILFSVLTYNRSVLWKDNIGLLSDILEKYPDSEIALNSLGAEYIQLNDFTVADEFISKALNLDSSYFAAYYNKAVILQNQKKYTEALLSINKCLEIQPTFKDAYFLKGLINKEIGNYSTALIDFSAYIKLYPNNGEAYYLAGLCNDLLGNTTEGINFYTLAIQHNFKDIYVYLNRSSLFGKTNDFKSALMDAKTAIGISPTSGHAYFLKGLAETELGRNGCSSFREAVKLNYKEAAKAIERYCH